MATKKKTTKAPKLPDDVVAALRLYANLAHWQPKGTRPWESQVKIAVADAGATARAVLAEYGVKIEADDVGR